VYLRHGTSVCRHFKTRLESGPVTADLTTTVVHSSTLLINDVKPDHSLENDINGTLTTKLYNKRDDFHFPIVNYLSLDSKIPSSPAYGVYMSQSIRYSRTCNSYQNFLHRSFLLTRKLLNQGFIETRLRSILKKLYFRHHHLTLPYRVSVITMVNDTRRPWYCCHEHVSFLDTT